MKELDGRGVVMIASYKFHFIREHDNLNMNINPPNIQRKHMDGIYTDTARDLDKG